MSQLSRAVESAQPAVPMLSDLRESGQVEQDADVVMFVYREEYYDRESERLGEADIIFAKHRNGPVGARSRSPSAALPALQQHVPRARRRAVTPSRTERLMLRPVDTEERLCPYGECDGSTWVIDEERNEARPCRCREQRRRRALSGGIGTGIGRRFLEVSFDRSRSCRWIRSCCVRCGPSCARSTRTSRPAAARFDGPVGTGKTSLAILVAKAAKDAGRSYAVYPVPRLLAEIKRTFDRDASDTYLAFFRRLCSVDVLVLDDLGAEKQTEWVLEQLYSIVNERWQDRRSIVVTTNIPDADPEAPGRMLSAGARAAGRQQGRPPRRPRSRRAAPDSRAARARER